MMRRSMITGVGTITNVGLDTETTWNGLINGRSGIDTIDIFDPADLPVRIAGQIRGFAIEDYGFSKHYTECDRSNQLGLAATQMAMEDSGILSYNFAKERTGVFIGNAGGALCMGENIFDKVVRQAEIGENLYSGYFRILAARSISNYYNLTGPSQIISTGCTSGLDSIGQAARAISRGEVDIAICGGAEAPITPATLCAFAKIGALSSRNDSPQEASRPYDKDRDGFVLAEGAGIIVLESLEHAVKRNAKLYGEVVGFATNCSAYHMTGMPSDGKPIAAIIQKSLETAKLGYDEVDYINSHGSSTPMNDLAESSAYKAVFGEKAAKIPISSIKSMIGHSLGSIGSIETVVCSLILENQMIPPTININELGAGCDLDYVPNRARKAKVDTIVTNGSGFSGINSVLVLKKWREDI
jgi:3-oxoacyl-[acyl-carrier-protein] synthase II